MSNKYKDVSLFNDIEDAGHRAWNRLNVITNLNSDGRPHDAHAYLTKLSESGKLGVAVLLMAINEKGLEVVRKELNKGELAV